MRKLLSVVAGAVMLFGVQLAFAADLKIAVIDLKTVLQNSVMVEEKRKLLQGQFEPLNKEMIELQKKLQDDDAKYAKDSAVMKEQEKKDAIAKLTEQGKKLREMQVNFQQKLTVAEEKAMQEVSDAIQKVVDGIAKEKKFDLILAKGAVAYSNPSFEITDEVLKNLGGVKSATTPKEKK